MLRALPSGRRRPRYGAHLCAVFAALLLLLSVVVLHSRLGFDRRFPFASSSPDLQFSDDSEDDDITAVVTNPLLGGDADTDAAGAADEDRIDELDIVEEETDDQSKVSDEEQILRGVELEEESELDGIDIRSGRGSRSGYFWDHIVGVRRRAFDNRAIDPWEDYSGFDFSSSSSSSSLSSGSDQSKIAFGSDDQPVDEEVRRKLGSIRTIEDALLLKTSSKGSALRDGWANWFEKKGDFLRRDRMFKSNLELLNPSNNLLLQDPDGVGLTVLTRGDKLMQKALLDEFHEMPFVVKKTFGVVGGGDKNKKKRSGENGKESMRGRRNEVKGTERRTLDDNGGDGKNIISDFEPSNLGRAQKNVENSDFDTSTVKELGTLSDKGSKRATLRVKDADKVDDLSIHKFPQKSSVRRKVEQIRSETSGHLYADGKRWGYFPGLLPHLSFSGFMEEFFRHGKCLMKVFMVWNSPPWMFSVRHQRGLESVLYHHPDACVVVFSETLELDFFNDFVKDGYKVSVAMPNLDELLKNTPTHVFASVWFEWRKTKLYPTHYSELVRLAALHKYGGVYLDCDIIVLKPLLSLHNSVGLENPLDNISLNGAVMTFRKNSPFILECLKEFYTTYDDTRLRWNGADLLTRVGSKAFSGEKNSETQVVMKMQPSFMFFPIGPQNIIRYFAAPADDTERALQDILFKKILDESFTFHFWNSITSSLIPEPESLVARLLNHHCMRCLDTL